jgi:H+-transporting ATPase
MTTPKVNYCHCLSVFLTGEAQLTFPISITANPAPDRWNLPALFLISSILAAVCFLSSLLLLHFLLDSWNPDGFIQKLGMDGLKYGQVITSIYLKVSVSDFLTLFSARTREHFFFQVKPGPMLLAGGIIALSISSVLSIVWPEGEQDHIAVLGLQSNMGLFGFVWIFCLIFWFIQDTLKVIFYRLMYKYNFNGIATSGVVVLPESALKIIQDLENEMSTVAAAHH